MLKATQATASTKSNHQCLSQQGLPCPVFISTKLQQVDLGQLSVRLTLSLTKMHTQTHTRSVRGFALAIGTGSIIYPESCRTTHSLTPAHMLNHTHTDTQFFLYTCTWIYCGGLNLVPR